MFDSEGMIGVKSELPIKSITEIQDLLFQDSDARELLGKLEIHHPETVKHLTRVAFICSKMADRLGYDAKLKKTLIYSAALHDVGKLSVSENTLNQKEKPTDEEWQEIREHPSEGFRKLRLFADPVVKWVAVNHHRLQGNRSYPDGLVGTNLLHLPNDLTDEQLDTFRKALYCVVAADMNEATMENRSYHLREYASLEEIKADKETTLENVWKSYSGPRQIFIAARMATLEVINQPTVRDAIDAASDQVWQHIQDRKKALN